MNKQIEEMAWDLCDIPKHPSIKSCEQCGNKHCLAMYYAKRACNKGYRKTADVAREIFAEIELLLDTYSASHHSIGEVFGESYFERGLEDAISKLKKKYESEGADDE